jgi:hypothetical protein
MFFQQPDVVRPMPAGMAKLDREAKIGGQLRDKFAEGDFLLLWPVGGWKLDEDDAQFRCERFERAQKRAQFLSAIAQPALVGDFTWQFACEPKVGRRHFEPAAGDVLRRRAVKSRVDLNRRKMVRVKFQPAIGGQIRRVEHTTPFLEAPGTGADPDFLLLAEIQNGWVPRFAVQGLSLSRSSS